MAVGYASNAVGTINDVKEIVRLAHEKGALAYIDAVHYAPHGPFMSATSIAISWCARATSFSGRTWGFSTASANTCSACSPTRCAPTPTPSPAAGNGAR